ncbi:MAG: hypothetical protein H9897_00855, partial [Candidatus Ureaplasma intestinipullorum]|nr:hypothetical protein [Candidatus Ureaplasma intestinipullorum]
KIISNNGNTILQYLINQEKIEIFEEGKILINPRTLLEIANKLNDEWIELNKIEETVLIIKTNKFNAQINLINEFEYPITNFDNYNNEKINFTINDIDQIIQKVSWSTLPITNEIKPICGVYIDSEINPNKITCLGTDSYKITYLTLENKNNSNFNFIIDNTTLKIMSELYKWTNDSNFKLSLNEMNKLFIENENLILIDKVMYGEYPKLVLNNAFNINSNIVINVLKKDLQSALERGKIFVNSERTPLVLINIENNKMFLEFSSYEFGSSKEEINIQKISGNNLKILLNVNFFLNLINTIDVDNVELHFENDTKPVVIYNDNTNFKELLLPIKNN